MVKMCTVNQRYFLCMWRDKTTRNIKNYIILWNCDENQDTIKSCSKTYMYRSYNDNIDSISYLFKKASDVLLWKLTWFFLLGLRGHGRQVENPRESFVRVSRVGARHGGWLFTRWPGYEYRWQSNLGPRVVSGRRPIYKVRFFIYSIRWLLHYGAPF